MNNKEKKTVFYIIVRTIFRAVRLVFPPVDMLRIYYLVKKNGNKVLKFQPKSFEEYCKAFGKKLEVVENAHEQIVYEPAYYPDHIGREHRFLSPHIYIAELENALVHGGSGLVITDNNALTDVCVNDTEDRVEYASGPIRRGTKKKFCLEIADGVDELDQAITLCGLAADNYYHLTIEILSRYEYVKHYVMNEGLPVLIDERAKKYPQFEELIRTVIGNAKVIYVPISKRVHCKRLVYPSMNSWMPMNVRNKNDFRISDNLLAESAVNNIRKATENIRQKKTHLKIFISRKNASLSRIINEEEVASLFKENGYDVICTEEMTYKEQVEVFSKAAYIVGASGAAMTNLIYCNPGTVFGCFTPKKYGFFIYSTIAHLVGCKTLFFDAKVVMRGETISTEQWEVDLNECENFMHSLETI